MIARWIALWDQRESPTSLAVTRVLVAAVILLDLLSAWALGLVPDAWAPPPFGLGYLAPDTSPARVPLLFGVALCTACLVLIGWFARPAAFILALTLAALVRLAPEGDRAIDSLLRIVLVVLALSRSDARFSLSAWLARRRGHPAVESVPAWPRYLLFLQLVWVYFSAAHNRGRDWSPAGGFSAIAEILSDPPIARFAPGWTASIYPLTQLATATTMAFELCAPLFLLATWLERQPDRAFGLGHSIRRYRLRWAWLVVGVGLHLGIALTMRLGIFPFGILALYPLFLHPHEIEVLLARLRWRASQASPGRPVPPAPPEP